jgi:hypothetical protein
LRISILQAKWPTGQTQIRPVPTFKYMSPDR